MKLLLLALLVTSLLLAGIFGFVGLGAWSEAQAQCPDGNDCSDATVAALIGATVVVVSLLASTVAIRKLLS
jgi:hypothetical protein